MCRFLINCLITGIKCCRSILLFGISSLRIDYIGLTVFFCGIMVSYFYNNVKICIFHFSFADVLRSVFFIIE